MTTMRPIDTAPRDGTTILLADKDGNFADGYWLAEAHKGKGAWIWPYLRREPAFWGQLPCRPSNDGLCRTPLRTAGESEMTTQVIIKSPAPNHQDVLVKTVSPQTGYVMSTERYGPPAPGPGVTEQGALSPDELRAVRRYKFGTGCEYPDMPCEYCDAFVRALRDPTLRDKSDWDIDGAYKAGARVRRGWDRRRKCD